MSGGLPMPPGRSPLPDDPGAATAAEPASSARETARAFFDRPPPDDYLAEWARRLALPEQEAERDLRSVVIFRLNAEWLALDTIHLVEITDPHTVHSLPHRTNPVLIGMVNVRGQLRLCVSLHGLLGVGAAPPDAALKVATVGKPGQATYARMIIIQLRGEEWVFPADEVLGVQRFTVAQFRKAPSTYTPLNSHTQAVLDWKGHTVGHLDTERLVTSLRSHCQ
jgi:chemotaxis-related protein WspD